MTAPGRATSTVVDITDLAVSFATDAGPVDAVTGVTLQVRAGEVLAIVGESGSGKTVTARSILGLLPETARVRGAVVLRSKDGRSEHDVVTLSGSQLREVRGEDAAMVFQEPSTSLNPVFPVGWQIAEGLRAHGKYSRKEARAKAIDVLRRVGIPDPEHRVDHYPHQFSGGQKQRIVIAQALVLDPGVIIADEPTTALDVTVQAEILELLRRCRDDFGAAIVLITHNMGVVADLADRVAVMYEGEIVEQADVRTLFSTPSSCWPPSRGWGRASSTPASAPRAGRPAGRRRRRSSRPATCGSSTRGACAGRTSPRSTGSASRSARARCSAWWGRAAAARRRSAGPSPA
jgi:peptide/nickel transport system ATP-binding protein